ncbi:MAG: tyrosine-type recombinase/integrase [Nitrososphaerota archaeon]|nr:tyrosine-type recombinase/integrase [Nitrososphaerota archaeon]MDG6929674.1 tyrosine-type recombinase/integrase [Nitrososphaerota archaeon]
MLLDNMDIHRYDKALKYSYNTLEKDRIIPETDKKLIVDFTEHLKAKGISTGRVTKYMLNLMTLRRQMKCDFAQADRKEIERLMGWLNSSDYSPHTKLDYKGELKRFYKWLRNGSMDSDIPFPPEVAWIKENMKHNEMKQPDILTDDEAKRMIDAAGKIRDKAFIAVAFEGGFRIGEILTVTMADLTFDSMGARLKVRGKTGERTVRLITSAPLLARWVDEHPMKGNPQAPLWISLASNYRDRLKPVSYERTVLMLKRVAQKAGIQKRIYPHLFRHSAATRDAKYLTESELKVKFGWTGGSEMPGTYVHLASVDLDNKLASVYSGQPVETPKPGFAPMICPKCGEKNTPGQRYCGRCGTPLNADEIAKSSIELEEMKQKINAVYDILKKYIQG